MACWYTMIRVITPPGRQVLRFARRGRALRPPALGGPGDREAARRIGSGPGPEGVVSLAERARARGATRDSPWSWRARVPLELLVDGCAGVGDLADAEAFRLPERSVAARPSPFSSALRFGEVLYLELVPAALLRRCAGWAGAPPPEPPDLAPAERELVAERGAARWRCPSRSSSRSSSGSGSRRSRSRPRGSAGCSITDGPSTRPGTRHRSSAARLRRAAGERSLLDAGGTTAGVLVDRVLGLSRARGRNPCAARHGTRSSPQAKPDELRGRLTLAGTPR